MSDSFLTDARLVFFELPCLRLAATVFHIFFDLTTNDKALFS
jgi:hypothetical protein